MPPKKPTDSTAYDAWFAKYEQVYNLPPNSLKAMAWEESRFNEKAVAPQVDKKGNPNGGHGLMQFVRSTAREYGIDPFNPEQSIRAAGEYMANALRATGGDVAKAFQAYNMGVQGARRFFAGDKRVAGDPKYAEKVLNTLSVMSNGPANKYRDPKTVAPPPPVAPTNDAEALEFGTFGTPMAAADTLGVSPKQATWNSEMDSLAMSKKLHSMFAELSAEHEQAARGARARLESLLDEEA